MISFLTFLPENQRQGPEDRPISTSFYLLKLKDFKGGPLKQNLCPLICVRFWTEVSLSLAVARGKQRNAPLHGEASRTGARILPR